MSFVDALIAQVLKLEIALHHTSARLAANTDAEALHDLRINVRRLRSLLKPLRGKDGVALLDEAAADVGQLTTPVRDLEVLVDELHARGLSEQASVRRELLHSSYACILESSTLNQFFIRLDEWPSAFRAAELRGELHQLPELVAKRLRKQIVGLQTALANPEHDPHRLRLLVKRTRYATDAYPQHSPISVEAAVALKAVQSSLGNWHDRYQWCLKASREPDLEVLRSQWQAEAHAALIQAEEDWRRLGGLLPRGPKMKLKT
ncbi:CHAD domain-containing protein [Pseudomonas sp. BN606]|nr:CHAD domain-containing protein [Pseudomonas sp. BN606]